MGLYGKYGSNVLTITVIGDVSDYVEVVVADTGDGYTTPSISFDQGTFEESNPHIVAIRAAIVALFTENQEESQDLRPG